MQVSLGCKVGAAFGHSTLRIAGSLGDGYIVLDRSCSLRPVPRLSQQLCGKGLALFSARVQGSPWWLDPHTGPLCQLGQLGKVETMPQV